MDGKSDSGRPARRLIDAETKARFVAALRAGASREAAAAEAGFPLKSYYGARRRDPLFRLAWIWALALSAADEQAARLAASAARWEGVPIRFASQGGRIVQRRRMRWVRFDEARRQIFLDHFAGTADAGAAAEAAGVSYATVSLLRRRDPDFAARWAEALRIAYPRLEAEALRQRLVAQQQIRAGIMPAGEIPREFDRVMKLLARWDRKNASPGPRQIRHGRQKRWTFDEAMEALEKKLRNLVFRLPPEEE